MAVPSGRARWPCPVVVPVVHGCAQLLCPVAMLCGRARWPWPWLWWRPWQAIAVAVEIAMVVAVAMAVVVAMTVAVPHDSDHGGSRDKAGCGSGSAGRGGQELLKLSGCLPRQLTALIASQRNVPNVFAHAPQFTHFA